MDDEGRLSGGALMPRRLAWVLVCFRHELMFRWSRRVLGDAEVPDASRLSEPALHDNIPELIDKLLVRLARHPSREWGERVARELADSDVGVAHARQRVAAHYTLAEALRELSHFRAAVVELCDEHDVVLTIDEVKLLHATIDELMVVCAAEIESASVRSSEGAAAHRP